MAPGARRSRAVPGDGASFAAPAALSDGYPFSGFALWLFDFDNTLALLEPEVDWGESRRELETMLRSSGVGPEIFAEFPRGNLMLYEALRARLLASKARASSSGAPLLHRASEIIEKYELRGAARAAPLPGAVALLRELGSSGRTIAIVTSNASRTVGTWLEAHRVAVMVRAIVGRETLLALKPAPDMIERALALCATPRQAAVLVGDSEADLFAARRAGTGFVGIAAKLGGREKLVALGARAIFSSPAALGAELKRHRRAAQSPDFA